MIYCNNYNYENNNISTLLCQLLRVTRLFINVFMAVAKPSLINYILIYFHDSQSRFKCKFFIILHNILTISVILLY